MSEQSLALALEKLRDRVDDIAVHGTDITKTRLVAIEADVREIKADVKLLVASKADAKDLESMQQAQNQARAAVRGAIIAASLSLAGSLILFAVSYAVSRGGA